MANEFREGMLVKVGDEKVGTKLHITTMNREGRVYERDKSLRQEQFLFGTIEAIYVVQKEIRKPVLDKDGQPTEDGVTGNLIEKVVQPERVLLRIVWDGPRYRISTLPGELVTPAINQAKR